MGFSHESQVRLRDWLMRLDWASVAAAGKRAPRGRGFFVTLTFADVVSFDYAKRCLFAFRRRLEREYAGVSAVWKLEVQRRGAPHFHLLLCLPVVIEWAGLAAWIRAAWRDVSGARVIDVQAVNRAGGVGRLMGYMVKYMGKRWAASVATGRVWGLWNSESLPWGDGVAIYLDRAATARLFDRVRAHYAGVSSFLAERLPADGGFTLMGDPYQLVKLLGLSP